ncbi:hypothetical protein L7F22_044876 [Adiantum nelumboides]|nr:hypothetical protein [Adiantum nelumboides]
MHAIHSLLKRNCVDKHGMQGGLDRLNGFILMKSLQGCFVSIVRESEFGKKGSVNIQHSAITEHVESRAHEDARYMFGVKKVKIQDSMRKRKDVAMQGTKCLFASAYHVAKEDQAFAKFSATLDLLECCECPHLMREYYQHDKACAMFVQCISEDLLGKIVQRIKDACFFSLMMDESTDIGLDQHLVVYASFIEDFEPVTVFLGLLEIEEGTSQHLFERSCIFLSQLGLDSSKMICLGTDGASAMTGRINGLTARFKRVNPFMTSVHCVAHRTSLCLTDAVKNSTYALYIDQVVNEVVAVFSKTAAKSAMLETLEAEFGCAILHLSRIHKIRWLSRASAMHKICECFEPLLVFLKEHNAAVFEKVSNFCFMYSIHFMADILERLAILSQIFQSTFVDITAVVSLIEAEIRLIQMQFIDVPIVDVNAATMDREEYHIIPDYGPSGGQLAALRASMRGKMYRSVVITRDIHGKDMDDAIVFQHEFSGFIICNLLERFPDMGLIECFKALSPCSFPTGVELRNYGFDKLNTLVAFYGEPKVLQNDELASALIDKICAKREYELWKAQAPYEWKGRSLRDAWLSIGRNSTTQEKYPVLLKLAHFAMLQCASTAACERGFSTQNTIKNRLRNCLGTKSLDALMRITIEGPPIKAYNFDNAIAIWKNDTKTSRHIFSESRR